MTDALMCTDTNGDAHVVGVMSDNAEDIKYDTNNSVKDMLDVKLITPVLNTDYIDDTSINTIISVYQYGKMIVIDIQGIAFKSNLSGHPAILSGLPIPLAEFAGALTNKITGSTSLDGGNTSRYRLRSTGELELWYDNVPQNSIPFGQIIYFTN